MYHTTCGPSADKAAFRLAKSLLRRSDIYSHCCLQPSFASLPARWTCIRVRRDGATGAIPDCWASSVQVRTRDLCAAV